MGEIGEHYRDVKRKRSRRSRRSRKERRRNSQAENAAKSASPPSPTRCWDWMIVSGDCYYARDRSSFKTYRSVRGTTSSLLKDTTSRIAGVGTVELEVRRSRNREDTHTLVLKNVLHIPKAICNGVCSQMACDVQEFGGEAQAYDRKNGGGLEPTWYGIEFGRSRKLSLAGNPQGESFLKEGSVYMLSVYLSEDERRGLFGRA